MYLIFLVKDGKEEAFSIIDEQPTQFLQEKLQGIANFEGYPVVARSHYPIDFIGNIQPESIEHHAEPAIPPTKPEKTKLEKVLSGEDA